LHEFAQSAAQEPAGTGTAETAAQLAEQASDATWRSTCGRTLSKSAKHFSDLVPVLVARDREQPQEGRHGRESAAHCVAPHDGQEKRGSEIFSSYAYAQILRAFCVAK